MTVERMIELLEIEKECVLRNASGGCNRYCAGCDLLQDDTELHEMYTGAIALLKAQEPRVMHVDEIQEFSTVWLEDVDKPEIIPAIYLEPLCGRLGFIQPGRGMIYPKADECGKRWRPWTSRPTDAQKEAVKWE